MNIPGGVDMPGAELVWRVHDLAPDPDTLVVVNCAGRTRSIIGCQSLRNAGLPNRVVALKDGTMGWDLAGFECERGATRVFDLGPTTAYRTVCHCYTGAFVLVLNQQTWDSLSPAQQQVLTEHSGRDLALRLAREHVAMADEVEASYWPENGVESIELSDEEFARWRAAVQPVLDQWIAEREAEGVPGQEMVDRVFGGAS